MEVNDVCLGIGRFDVQARAELEKLRQAAEAGREEKDEMGRLYNELLEQLRMAEEEKEELRVGGMC